MIKAAITGAHTPAAARLIRTLVHHPDVMITQAISAQKAGRAIVDTHPGLVGDISLNFTSQLQPEKADVVFFADNTEIDLQKYPDLRIVDITGTKRTNEYVPGIPELFRKQMVRGARAAYIPNGAITLAVTALLPLAKNLLLNAPLSVTIADKTPITDTAAAAHETAQYLQQLQNGFNATINIHCQTAPSVHIRTATITTKCTIDMLHIDEIYNNYFDDHNFTYNIARRPTTADIANTAKTLINIQKDGDTLTLCAAHDPLTRGNAAVAVHCMNLLFGLHERTGLTLTALGHD